jgi:Protein of unknown function (DUF3455)
MKLYPFKKFAWVAIMASAATISCNRDENVDTNSPAFHIAESEKLVMPAAIDLPPNLPAGNARAATFYAEGVQRYKAKPVAGTNQFEWTFVAPKADLFDVTNKKVGTHSAGPTWQLLGSTTDSIYAQAFTPAKTAASPDANSIDWLQLMPKTGKTPTGLFTNVSYIQRIATKGGKAPLTAPANATDSIDVPYTAVYRFTRKNP